MKITHNKNILKTSKERSVNSMRNIFFSVSTYCINAVVAFIKQTVFLRFLSVEYQGVSNTLMSILGFLSLSELGIGTAISYALYKPLLDKDTHRVASLMKFYQRCYFVIGTVILILGIAIMPFLSFFMKEVPEGIPISSIRVYFMIYLIDTVSGYYLSYKRILIMCDQKEYISSISTGVSNLLMSVVSIIVLIYTQSFFAYLLVMVISKIVEYLFISAVSDHLYKSYLHNPDAGKLSSEELTSIKENVLALVMHSIGGVIVFSSDNLIISKFVGVTETGLYGNYVLILSHVDAIINRIFSSTTSSVGNLIAEKDSERIENVFDHMLFMNCWCCGWTSICLLCLTQSFIELWLGERFLLSYQILVVAVLSRYILGVRNTVLQFKSASGIFRQDRFKPLLESVINIVVSIPLAIRYGIIGVLAGTIVSTISVAFWFEALVLYRALFDKGIGKYLKKQLFYLLYNTLLACLCVMLCNGVDLLLSEIVLGYSDLNLVILNVLGFVVKGFICLVMPNTIYYMCFRNSENMDYFRQIIRKYLSERRGRLFMGTRNHQ